MGQGPSGMPGGDNINKKKDDKKKEKPKYEPPVETKFGKKKRRGPDTAVKLPSVYPNTRCSLLPTKKHSNLQKQDKPKKEKKLTN